MSHLAGLGLLEAWDICLAGISLGPKARTRAGAPDDKPLARVHDLFHDSVDFISLLVVLPVDLVLHSLEPLKLFVGPARELLLKRWLVIDDLYLRWRLVLVLVGCL